MDSIPPDLQSELLEPSIEAAGVALREWAGTEVVVRLAGMERPAGGQVDVEAAIELKSETVRMLVFEFSAPTARALAERALRDTQEAVSEEMVRDCMGEIANVTAGQAKALLAGTRHHITITPPRFPARSPESDCLTVVFASDSGDIVMRLVL